MEALAAAALAFAIAYLATPLAIRLAQRTNFYDHPFAYKAHGSPTPYLGGTAVIVGFLAAALPWGGGTGDHFAVVACAAGLWLVGTADDRANLGPALRVVIEAGAAVLLWWAGLGWSLFDSDFLDLLLTTLWVVGLINAFNLMDNMDGATGMVGAASLVGVGTWAGIESDAAVAALAFAMAGACLGFLPRNLTSPARIFLGDGGSMPIGFVVAATAMLVPTGHGGPTRLLEVLPLVALPALDTALVIVSRLRRGVPLMTGGNDHITHRLRTRLPSARAVAFTLGGVQASLCAVGIAVASIGEAAVQGTVVAGVLVGIVVVAILESSSWAPARPVSAD